MKTLFSKVALGALLLLGVAFILFPRSANAHCDTLDGPVVIDARASLEKGDVTPVLKWVKPEYDQEIRTAFENAVKVRLLNAEAKGLADMYFFETLVRIHRAGEGAPYTGLKPVGTALEPGVAVADQSLVTGHVETLIQHVNDEVSAGIKQRYDHVVELKKHENDSVVAGRAYVAAYVEYVHFVERLVKDATSNAAEHDEGAVGNAHQD